MVTRTFIVVRCLTILSISRLRMPLVRQSLLDILLNRISGLSLMADSLSKSYGFASTAIELI